MKNTNCQMPEFEAMMESAKKIIEKRRKKRELISKILSSKGRYLICEYCGQSYGNEHIPKEKYETVNECFICKGEV